MAPSNPFCSFPEETTASCFRRRLALLSVVVFVLHFAVGAWYATHAENLPHRVSIWAEGDEFLAMYTGWNTVHERDDAAHNRFAVQVLKTGLPRDRSGNLFLYTPVYSYFLAACYKVGGLRFLSVALPQAIASGLTCWLVGSTAFRLAGGSATAGFLAALLYGVNLRISMYVGMISPTILVLFCTALALRATASFPSRAAVWTFFVAIAVGIYTQASFFVVAGAAVLWLAAEALGRRRVLPAIAAAGMLCLAILNVWMTSEALRRSEYGRKGEGEPGILWEANNPYYESMALGSAWERRPGNPWTSWKASKEEKQRFEEYLARARSQRLNAGALWIRENPSAYAKLCLVRLKTTLGATTGQMSSRNRLLSTGFWILTFPAGFFGLWRLHRLSEARLAALVILAIVAFSTLVITEWYLRYRLPMDLLLTVFAGPGWLAVWNCWRPGTAGTRVAADPSQV